MKIIDELMGRKMAKSELGYTYYLCFGHCYQWMDTGISLLLNWIIHQDLNGFE